MSDIVDKIRKLMALAAAGSGATEAEMATAMAMAQALMMKHAIDEDQLVDKKAGVGVKQVDELFNVWAAPLASAAGIIYMVKPLQQVTRDGALFSFIGRSDACEAATIMLKSLELEVERLYATVKARLDEIRLWMDDSGMRLREGRVGKMKVGNGTFDGVRAGDQAKIQETLK